MCPVPVPKKLVRKERILPFEVFKETLDGCKTLISVGLNNWGEPLLHPRITDMISYSTGKGLYTIFATNASLLTKELSHDIIRSGLTSIEFSIDGGGETYKKIRNTEIEPILQNINHFVEINKKYGNRTHTCIVYTVSEYNKHEANQFSEMWGGKVDSVRFQPYLTFLQTRRNSPCPELSKSHLVVLTDGRVVPCCADFNGSLTVGYVPDQSLNGIYNGLILKRLRAKHKHGDFEGACLYCSEYETDIVHKRFQ